MRYFSLILKNSWRNRRRTTLTVLSVGVSMCLLGLLMAIYHAFFLKEVTPERALRLITRNRVSLAATPMPESYGQRIRQVPGVREVMMNQWYGGVYKDRRDPKNMFARFAAEPDRLFTVMPEYQVSEDQKTAFQRDRTGALIGRDLAAKLDLEIGDRVTLQGDIFPGTLELTVRAIFDSPGLANEVLYFHREYLEESLPAGRRGNISTFTILAENTEVVPAIAAAVDEMFRNAPIETKTETEQAFALSFVSFLGNVKVFLLSVCAAVTFTILLVSANTMAMSVRERVREIGILKTLGFTRPTIMGVILGEAGMIAFAGGLLGLLLTSALCGVVRQGPAMFAELKMLYLAPDVAAVCLAAAVIIGVASAFVPAWTGSRVTIVEALRTTD
jgi:putative ABC transport system permease protein